MLSLEIKVNNHAPMMSLQVVRISPSLDNPYPSMPIGTPCIYQFYVDSTYAGIDITHPYTLDYGASLGVVMLQTYLKLRDAV